MTLQICFVQINQNCLLLRQLTRPHLHHNFLCWFRRYHHLHRYVYIRWSSKYHSISQHQHQHQQKYYWWCKKFEFSSKSLDKATWYGATNSPSWKTSSPAVNSSFLSWTLPTRPLGLVFTMNNQSTLERFFLKEGVYV